MKDKLDAIGVQALEDLGAVKTLEALEQVRVSVLGKKGALSEVLKGLGAVPPAERPVIGSAANEWKKKVEAALELRRESLEAALLTSKLQNEKIDISLPS